MGHAMDGWTIMHRWRREECSLTARGVPRRRLVLAPLLYSALSSLILSAGGLLR